MMTKDEALRGLTIGDCRTRREAVKTVKELLNREECEDAISRTEVIKSIDEREDVNGKVDAESVRTDIVLMQPVNPQNCDACEVGNPCLYCKHEFEERSSEE